MVQGHALEYANDFVPWPRGSLEERALAEHLFNIDPDDFRDLAEPREVRASTLFASFPVAILEQERA